jgi:hypothetical protein
MTLIDSWDSGQPGARWDSGLQWDANEGTVIGDISPWLALVTSRHADKPKFMVFLALVLQPLADIIEVAKSMPGLFDLDTAVGDQLVKVGEWVGVTNQINVPLTGVYFSLDTPGVGLDQGALKGPFDPNTGLVVLADEQFRTLIRARIAANHWDGTIPGAYAIWDTLFASTGFSILIQDGEDTTMIMALTGPVPDAVTSALFTGGLLSLKPAGFGVSFFMTSAVANTPFFGLDLENTAISGLDAGQFGTTSAGN